MGSDGGMHTWVVMVVCIHVCLCPRTRERARACVFGMETLSVTLKQGGLMCGSDGAPGSWSGGGFGPGGGGGGGRIGGVSEDLLDPEAA